MVILYTSGHNFVGKLIFITRIFSFIIPPERSAPPFWFYVYGTEGLILMPHCFKYFIICSFCITILLLHLSTVGDTFCWASIFIKKYWSIKMINSAVLSLK